jgi:hypothetical protein
LISLRARPRPGGPRGPLARFPLAPAGSPGCRGSQGLSLPTGATVGRFPPIEIFQMRGAWWVRAPRSGPHASYAAAFRAARMPPQAPTEPPGLRQTQRCRQGCAAASRCNRTCRAPGAKAATQTAAPGQAARPSASRQAADPVAKPAATTAARRRQEVIRAISCGVARIGKTAEAARDQRSCSVGV